MAEVDSNLNYLLGRLSLVTQEFNQIKVGLGKALDNIKSSFEVVQTKIQGIYFDKLKKKKTRHYIQKKIHLQPDLDHIKFNQRKMKLIIIYCHNGMLLRQLKLEIFIIIIMKLYWRCNR